MAFTNFVPATFDELLSQLTSFCSTDMGWSASHGGGTATITPKAGEATFVFTVADGRPGYSYYGKKIECAVTKGAHSFNAQVNWINGLANVWFFAGQTPEPWCHIVINSTPGQYHHLYFGYLERYGAWDCGAVATGTYWSPGDQQRDNAEDSYNSMLFSSYGDDTHGGGLILEGANALRNRGRFADYLDNEPSIAYLRGGFTDADNRRLIEPGLPLHNGLAPMAPILVQADFEHDGFWVPLGSPPGIRLFHISDFNPEQVITFGAADWQVFPLSDKTRSTNYQNWPEYPSGDYQSKIGGSRHLGVAVLRG